MFGIVCNARKGHGLGIRYLALVDRKRSKRLWWTSDNANIALCYRKRNAAEFAASRLNKNSARVVSFTHVQKILREQAESIAGVENDSQIFLHEDDPSWDAHKTY